MKNSFLKLYALLFLLMSNFSLFAQPGSDDGDGDLEGGDVPINGKLVFLAIAAVSFAFYYFAKQKQAKVTSN